MVLVDDKDHAFLDIANDDTAALRLEAGDDVGDDLGLAFAQKLLQAEIINAKFVADTGKEATLKAQER